MLSEKPTTVYDVIKKLKYPHSSAHGILKQYLREGIIKDVKKERCKSGLVKKYYMLTDLGSSLLSVLEKINENRQNNPEKIR
jgi:DNA-binding PadR family transcriptional regulator